MPKPETGDTDMPNPFDTKPGSTAPVKPATERSKSYLRDLMLDKAAHLGEAEDQAKAKIDAWFAKVPSQPQVSEAIGRLKSEGYTGQKHSFADTQPVTELEDGFYEIPGQGIIKIQHAIHGSGFQYGKELNTATGKFEKIAGAVRLVREVGKRLTVERARELGQLYGMCIRCGATLTDEESIERGMGPICAGKGF